MCQCLRDHTRQVMSRGNAGTFLITQAAQWNRCFVEEHTKKKLPVQYTRVTVCQKGSRQVWHITCLQMVLNVDARHDQSTRLTSLCVQTDSTFPSPAPRSRYLRGYPTYWYLSHHGCSYTWLKARTYQPLRSPEENGVAFLFLLTQRDNVLFFVCAW